MECGKFQGWAILVRGYAEGSSNHVGPVLDNLCEVAKEHLLERTCDCCQRIPKAAKALLLCPTDQEIDRAFRRHQLGEGLSKEEAILLLHLSVHSRCTKRWPDAGARLSRIRGLKQPVAARS